MPWVQVLWNASAAFLVLVSPQLTFLEHHSYRLFSPELGTLALFLGVTSLVIALVMGPSQGAWRALVFAAVLLVAIELLVDFSEFGWRLRWVLSVLLLACWLIRKELAKLLVGVFVVFNLATILQARWPSLAERKSPASTDLPLLVHLVLDSHEGLDALPRLDGEGGDLRAALLGDYGRHGFRVFGRAFSHYLDTKDSLGNMFNFSASSRHSEYFSSEDSPRMLRNAYFERLADRGYRLQVHQSSYLDFCAPSLERMECHTYAHGGLAAIGEVDAGGACKALLLERMLLQRSTLMDWVRRKQPWVWSGLAELDADLCRGKFPAWFFGPEPPSLASWSGLDVLEEVRIRLREAPAGTALFAHVILPHSPYFFREDCSRLPSGEWLDYADGPPAPPNDAASAQRRSARYVGQLRCLQRRLDRLLEELAQRPEAVWVVLHGDHGSRIVMRHPIEANLPNLTPADLVHGFSSWYAVRAPHVESGYDPSPVALEELLLATVVERRAPRPAETPYVFLRRAFEKQMFSLEIPEWSDLLQVSVDDQEKGM